MLIFLDFVGFRANVMILGEDRVEDFRIRGKPWEEKDPSMSAGEGAGEVSSTSGAENTSNGAIVTSSEVHAGVLCRAVPTFVESTRAFVISARRFH